MHISLRIEWIAQRVEIGRWLIAVDARSNQAALEAYDRARNMRARHAQFVERQQNLSGMAEQVSTQSGDREQVSPQGRDQPGNPLSPLRLGGASQQPAAPQLATDTATALAAVSQAVQAIASTIATYGYVILKL